MLKKTVFSFLFGLLAITNLSGCATSEQIQASNEKNRMEYLSRLQDKCDGYGFTRGTDAFAQCLQKADRDMQDAYQQDSQNRQELFKKSQCYATGRLDC